MAADRGEQAPRRIACSLYQSVCISNIKEFKEEGAPELLDDAETCAFYWGRNIHESFGKGKQDSHVPLRVTFGQGQEAQELRGVLEVACALNHMLFVVRQPDGLGETVYGCGLGSRGRLGSSSSNDVEEELEERCNPVRKLWAPPGGRGVRRICCGADHSLCLDDDNTVYAWGINSEGQCGVGHTKDVMRPEPLTGLAGVRVKHLTAGGRHCLLVGSSLDGSFAGGHVYTWGCNEQGRLGLGNTANQCTPSLVEALAKTDIIAASGGESHSGAIDSQQRVWMWGAGSYGRLGLGEVMDKPMPNKVDGALQEVRVAQLALGGFHSVALSSDDSPKVFTWGCGQALGLLKEGDNSLVTQPKAIDLRDLGAKANHDLNIVQIAAGTYHTLLLLDNGDMYSFGLGANGRLGVGGSRNCSRPAKVKAVQEAGKEPLPAGYFTFPPKRSEGHSRGQEQGQRQGEGDARARKATRGVQEAEVATAGNDVAPSEALNFEASVATSLVPTQAMHGGQELEAATAGSEVSRSEALGLETSIATSLVPTQSAAATFADLQGLLKKELAASKGAGLKKREAELSAQLRSYIEDIEALPGREAKLVQLQSNLDATFAKNLRFIKGLPSYGTMGSTIGAISAKLAVYEDLVWILQQQAAYLGSLAMCVDCESEQDTFYEATKRIYADLEDSRTLHLFMAMLKSLISKEIEQSKRLEDVFTEGKDRSGKDRSSVLSLFSFLALHEIHYKGLVYPIMDCRKPSTLMAAVINAYNRNEVFALSVEEYREAPQVAESLKDYDKKEVELEHKSSLDRFDAFMMNTFMKVIRAITLPDTIRNIFIYCVGAIEKRQFNVSAAGREGNGTSTTARNVEPLLKLFVQGVLVPMLRETAKYGGKAAYLGGELEKKESDNTGLTSNIKGMTALLEKMMGKGTISEQVYDRPIKRLTQKLKPELLKYVDAQMKGVTDDTNTQLLVDFYTAHFDLTPSTVLMPSSVLLRLSNVLRKNISKLSINDADPVAAICRDIDQWSLQDIEAAQNNECLHSFTINSRFLFKEKEMTICSISHCPVPPRMSTGSLATGQRFGNLLEPFMAEDTRFQIFEQLFSEVGVLQSTTFKGLRQELEREWSRYSSGPAQNIALALRLTEGLERLQELLTLDAKESEMLDFMHTSLKARERHREYLGQVAQGIGVVAQAKKQHQERLDKAETRLAAANRFSLTLQPSQLLVRAAADNNKPLRLSDANQAIVRREEFGRSDVVRELSYSPVVTHPLKRLLQNKVVVEADSLARLDVRLLFHLRSGGVDITILLRRNAKDSIVKQIALSEERLRELRKAEEGATVELPEEDPVLTFASSKLLELLANAAAGR